MKRSLAIFPLLLAGLIAVPLVHAEDAAVEAQPKVVNHLTMNQWVRSTDSGRFNGRVFLPLESGQAEALANVSVAMLSRNGEVVQTKTESDGTFTLEGVQTGVYAFTARGDDVFACCAMHVVDDSFAPEVTLPTEAEISVANVDYTIVNTAVIRYMPPKVKEYSLSLGNAESDGFQERVCGSDLFRVAQLDGGMKGRIHLAGADERGLVDASMTNVFLWKNGMEIERALTDDAGRFKFDKVDAGQYSLLAIGSGGIGLIGFELVDELMQTASHSQVAADETQLVGFGHQRGACCCQEFAMQIAPMPEVVNVVEEVVISETIVDEGIVCGDEGIGCGCEGEVLDGEVVMDGFGTPIPGGGYGGTSGAGYGGGGYSGGGGGGGGFGGGGFAGLAGLAAAAAVAASNNNDNNPIAIPGAASPLNPVSP